MSWLQDYINFTFHQESPEIFHLWTGITIIASVLNRNVWMLRRSAGVTRYRIFPGQIQTVLIAGSGHARKTAAFRIGHTMMKAAGVNLVGGKLSAESFIEAVSNSAGNATHKRLAANGQPAAIATLYASEIANFLSKQTYSETIADVITEVFDADDSFPFITKSRGNKTLYEPCLTLFAAGTPTSLGDSVATKVHSNGFLSRIFPIYATRSDRMEDLSDINDEDTPPHVIIQTQTLGQSLLSKLHDYRKLNGPYSFTPGGRDWFKAWYRTWFYSPDADGEGWPSRRADHLLRVAMVLRVSEAGDLVVDEDSLIAADLALKILEQNFHLAYANIGESISVKGQEKIINAIRVQGGRITSTILFRRVYRYFKDSDELRQALKTLRDSGVIMMDGVKDGEEWWTLLV